MYFRSICNAKPIIIYRRIYPWDTERYGVRHDTGNTHLTVERTKWNKRNTAHSRRRCGRRRRRRRGRQKPKRCLSTSDHYSVDSRMVRWCRRVIIPYEIVLCFFDGEKKSVRFVVFVAIFLWRMCACAIDFDDWMLTYIRYCQNVAYHFARERLYHWTVRCECAAIFVFHSYHVGVSPCWPTNNNRMLKLILHFFSFWKFPNRNKTASPPNRG